MLQGGPITTEIAQATFIRQGELYYRRMIAPFSEFFSRYPDPIPSDTAVPRWAYLDVTVSVDASGPLPTIVQAMNAGY